MPDVYNSAYTGTQIDAAISAVRNKEEVWDAKQNKLTGSPGQVVGFDDEGDAIATPAPSGLPDGGTEGQMLYKSADGAEWGDKPVMYVNITGDDSSGYAADKTASEIYEAYSNGNAVFATIDANIFELSNVSASVPDEIYSANFVNAYEATTVSVVEVSGISHVEVSFYTISPDAVNVDFTPASTLTSDNVQDAIIEVQGNVDAAKPVLRTATLTTSGWSSNSQTVTVNGIIADSASQSVDVVPADHNSAKAWGDAGVWCDSQGANTLTFSCESVPTANITLNIRFQEART